MERVKRTMTGSKGESEKERDTWGEGRKEKAQRQTDNERETETLIHPERLGDAWRKEQMKGTDRDREGGRKDRNQERQSRRGWGLGERAKKKKEAETEDQ